MARSVSGILTRLRVPYVLARRRWIVGLVFAVLALWLWLAPRSTLWYAAPDVYRVSDVGTVRSFHTAFATGLGVAAVSR